MCTFTWWISTQSWQPRFRIKTLSTTIREAIFNPIWKKNNFYPNQKNWESVRLLSFFRQNFDEWRFGTALNRSAGIALEHEYMPSETQTSFARQIWNSACAQGSSASKLRDREQLFPQTIFTVKPRRLHNSDWKQNYTWVDGADCAERSFGEHGRVVQIEELPRSSIRKRRRTEKYCQVAAPATRPSDGDLATCPWARDVCARVWQGSYDAQVSRNTWKLCKNMNNNVLRDRIWI